MALANMYPASRARPGLPLAPEVGPRCRLFGLQVRIGQVQNVTRNEPLEATGDRGK